MKKLVMIALVAVFAVSLFSCSKNKSIKNTSWTYQDQDEKDVVKFISSTDMSLTSTSGGQTVSFSGTYSYDAPNVTIALLGEAIKGVVDGSKLNITNDDGSITVFNKD